MLRVFRGDTLRLLDSMHLELGPNRVVYESKSKLVYVGYGGKDAGKDYGELGIVDAQNDQVVGGVKVLAHPSELLLDKPGKTLFAFRVHRQQTSGNRHPQTRAPIHLACFEPAARRYRVRRVDVAAVHWYSDTG